MPDPLVVVLASARHRIVPLRLEPSFKPGRPERWLYVVAGAGWLILFGHALLAHGPIGLRRMHETTSHGSSALGWAMDLEMWIAMIAATMLTPISPNVRFVALRSTRRSRTAATVDVVAGWALVWAGVGTLLAVGTWLLARAAGQLSALVITFAVASAWQLSLRKRLSLARCHRTFSPPLDRRGARPACRRFGVRLGTDCVASCWALMAAMAVSEHRLLVVIPLAWVSRYERRRPHHDPRVGVTAAVTALVGVVAVVTRAAV